MIVCRTKRETRAAVARARGAGRTVGLVPTMGALHEGHLSLIRRSVKENGTTVVSIFVNPTQFGPREDFTQYPRQLEEDLRICRDAGADVVFAPEAAEMYAGDFSTCVEETELSRGLCGAARPTHFRGVTTVVTKLLNIVQPDRAYFGQKDAQQAAVVNRMVRDLDMPVEIAVMPTVREADGLAKSSRNTHLSGEHRKQAAVLSQALAACQKEFAAGQRSAAALKETLRRTITSAHDARIDYVEIVDARTFQPVERVEGPSLAALAVFLGGTRLIDNATLVP